MSKLNIKPLADRVVVTPLEAETKQPQESLFLILLKKNRKKELLLLWAPAQKTTQSQ